MPPDSASLASSSSAHQRRIGHRPAAPPAQGQDRRRGSHESPGVGAWASRGPCRSCQLLPRRGFGTLAGGRCQMVWHGSPQAQPTDRDRRLGGQRLLFGDRLRQIQQHRSLGGSPWPTAIAFAARAGKSRRLHLPGASVGRSGAPSKRASTASTPSALVPLIRPRTSMGAMVRFLAGSGGHPPGPSPPTDALP